VSTDDLPIVGRGFRPSGRGAAPPIADAASHPGAPAARAGAPVAGRGVGSESARDRAVAPGLGARVHAGTDCAQTAEAGGGGAAYRRAIMTYRGAIMTYRRAIACYPRARECDRRGAELRRRAAELYRRALDLAGPDRTARTGPAEPGWGPSLDAAAGAGAAAGQRTATAGTGPTAERVRSPPTPPAATGWGPLTPREREVAGLVADGRTNREIATALVLVEGTVANYLRRLRLRLGLRSRAQVAAWVAVDDARRRTDAPAWRPGPRAPGAREPVASDGRGPAERTDDASVPRRRSA
jgi:DNA-binding CsgD family transcriptional regulator